MASESLTGAFVNEISLATLFLTVAPNLKEPRSSILFCCRLMSDAEPEIREWNSFVVCVVEEMLFTDGPQLLYA